jgi:hypothetical protein
LEFLAGIKSDWQKLTRFYGIHSIFHGLSTYHCEAFFAEACFLGSQSPGVTTEIASSPKTLLAMTCSDIFP